MNDNVKASDAYVVVEYVATMTSRQLYKIADVDGAIYGNDLYSAALANPKTPVFTLATFSDEISAKAHSQRFIIKKQRNAYEITFRAVGKILILWKKGDSAPWPPNNCPEDYEMGIIPCNREGRRHWIGGMTLVSTSLPESISKEQWQKR